MDRERMDLISMVADRALHALEALGMDDGWTKFVIVMDLSNCIEGGCDLDLDGMLTCRMADLLHDVTGINYNLNHETYKLENCFSPRMRKRK